ncbi:MAG TPA: BON domain-containing protein [Pyrinomonadaceae bacterium]|nr:BON domain-containing protein [Pyrinomonadaceae bacterium]
MSYDEEEARRSRVVVETPNSRREVVHSQSVRTPEGNGISAGMVGVLVVVAIALITMLVLFYMNSQQQPTDQTVATQQQQPPPPTVIQQPAQQPPVIIQQPAPATQPAPIVVTPPAGGAATTESAPNIDSTVQAAIDKALTDDPTFSNLGITASVLDGKVTLLGTVKTEDLKTQAERMVRKIKGVKSIDNQILVVAE